MSEFNEITDWDDFHDAVHLLPEFNGREAVQDLFNYLAEALVVVEAKLKALEESVSE